MNPEAPQKSVAPELENEEIIDNDIASLTDSEQIEGVEVESPDYSPEDTEGIARAAAGATDVIEGAVSGDRRMQSSYTHDGLRGVVEANVSDAHVRGEFDGSELKKVEITRTNSSGESVPVTVIHPESNNPKVMIGGEYVDPSKVPAVEDMINDIKSAAGAPEEKPEEEELEENSGYDDDEKMAA